MKGSHLIKRSPAMVLTVVLLVSCRVFTAPQADAVSNTTKSGTAGKYTVRVYFSQTGSVGSFSGNVGGKPDDQLGVVVRYKPTNGTGTSSNSDTKVTWNKDQSDTS